LHIIDFTLELSQLSPEAFVRDLLVPRFAPKHLVVGYDYAFGHRRSGDSDQLRALGETYGFTLEVVPPLSVDGTIPKSSLIRTLLHAGDVDQANHLLGRPYQLNGVVIKGKQLGRQLGFPTANLQLPPEKLVPAPGVYVCPGGVVNIDAQYLVEVHWFDFSSDVYGQTVSVDLLHHLRDERRFDSLDALKAQIQEDASAAKAFLKRFFPNAVFSVL
jgi:riboflavin kinase/FMN adenylyltransferase